MRILFKSLALSGLFCLVGTLSTSASSTSPKVIQAYKEYQEKVKEGDSQETQKALKKIEKICNKECTRFSCKNKDLQRTCIRHCPSSKIKNCAKGANFSEELELDENNVPQRKKVLHEKPQAHKTVSPPASHKQNQEEDEDPDLEAKIKRAMTDYHVNRAVAKQMILSGEIEY